MTTSFFDHTRSDIARLSGSSPRAIRLYRAVYQQRVEHFEQMVSVSANDAAVAIQHFNLNPPTIAGRFESADGTRRFLIQLHDGETVESVLIPETQRFTFCVSSQVGCALGCKFCLTGQLGLSRNLSSGEIVSQVLLLRQQISREPSRRFSVVLMGMGEPLQNYENVLRAIDILSDDHGVGLSLRRITLSTAGLLPGIERLAGEPLFPNLSISLSGATDQIRDELMPINRKYPIKEIIAAVGRLPEKRRKRVMFEYVMIKGITDPVEHAEQLAALLGALGSKVNLIPLNPSPDIPFQRSEDPDILRFQQILIQHGITTFIRRNRGNDISGACGQLKKSGQRESNQASEANLLDNPARSGMLDARQ